jgi:hypothetical protein
VQTGLEGYLAGDWFFGIEGYVRRFHGVATINPADNPDDPADDLLAGTGRSYGVDGWVRRERGWLRPMLSISWLRATRDFPDVRSGEEPAPVVRYAPVFDRRLNVNLVVRAALPCDLEVGLRWTFGSGLPYTRPVGAYTFYEYDLSRRGWRPPGAGDDAARSAIVLGPRNAERYPAYHRLDVSVRRTHVRRWGSFTPQLDIVNPYDRRNVLFYFYEYDRAPPTRSGISMFPFLPTLGLELRFR